MPKLSLNNDIFSESNVHPEDKLNINIDSNTGFWNRKRYRKQVKIKKQDNGERFYIYENNYF